METFLFVLAIVLWPMCFMIIGLILLQGGAGDLSSAFGGGGQLDSTLGVGAGRKMSKLTGWLAIAFLVSVTLLSIRREVNVGDLAPSEGASSSAPIDATGDAEATNTPNSPAVGVPIADPGSAVGNLVAPAMPTVDVPTVDVPATPVVPVPAVPAAPDAVAPAVPAPADPAAPAKLKLDD